MFCTYIFIPREPTLHITYRNESYIHHIRRLQSPLSLVRGSYVDRSTVLEVILRKIDCTKAKALAAQSCLTLCDPMDGSTSSSSFTEFSRQVYWSGLPFPSPGGFPEPGIKPGSPALPADSLPSEPSGKTNDTLSNTTYQLFQVVVAAVLVSMLI